jgi:hypothetical protein
MHVQRTSLVASAQLEGREEAEQADEVGLVARERLVDRVVEGGDVRMVAAGDRDGALFFEAITQTTSAGRPASMCSKRFSRLVPLPESRTAMRSLRPAAAFSASGFAFSDPAEVKGAPPQPKRLRVISRVAGDLFSV